MEKRHRFKRYGFVKVQDVLSASDIAAVKAETYSLIEKFCERRDLALETTGGTPRKMSVVRSSFIREHGRKIVDLSRSQRIVDLLQSIAGEPVNFDVSDDEEYLITHQTKAGDTHGWHWGDYSFALIWIIDTPPVDYGGMLQCVPHSYWDKENPRINQWLCRSPIYTYGFVPGDVYFLRTDTTLHRTSPLSKDANRIILNMTYASAGERGKNLKESQEDRWWESASVKKAKSLSLRSG